MNSVARLLAVAAVTFKEIWRSGALWVPLVAGGALAVGAPFLDYEGGPAGRLRVIISATLGAAALVGTLLAIGLAAITFSREIETRTIYVTTTKPLSRWTLFGGKLCGVGLALAAALALAGAGGAIAARAAIYADAHRAEDPAAVLTNLDFCREQFPAMPPGSKPVWLSGGESRSYELAVPAAERARGPLKLRLYARPANPQLRSARVLLTVEGRASESRHVYVRREGPTDVVLNPSPVRDGRLRVTLAPAADAELGLQRILLDGRGGVALAVRAEALETALAKGLALVWMQLLVVAAVTLAAAGVLSFPVAVVAGAAAALAGHLSGLAVGVLSLAVGKSGAAAPEQSGLGQLLRRLAALALSALPDFDRWSASELLAAGNFVPWGLLFAAAVSLVALRALPVALAGCLAFARREVGK